MMEFYEVTDYIRPGADNGHHISGIPHAGLGGPYDVSFDLKASTEPTVITNINSSADSVYNAVSIMLNNKTVTSVGAVRYKGWQDTGFPDTGIRKPLLNKQKSGFSLPGCIRQ